MATMIFLAFILALVGVSDGSWCICKQDGSVSNTNMQTTLDYACGAGADCGPIHQNGPCYNPNTVAAHCSYAANSYYQRNGQSPQACDFSGTAIITQSDPSPPGCTFPPTPAAAGTGTSGTPGMSGTPTGSNTSSGTGTGAGGTLGSSTFAPPGSSFTPGSTLTPGSTFPNSPANSFGLGPSGTGMDSNDSPSLMMPNWFLASLPLAIFTSVIVLTIRII